MKQSLKNTFIHKRFFLFKDLRYWSLPTHLTVEVTNRCNLRCSHCFQSHFSFPRGDLKPEVWEKVKKVLNQVKSVSLSSAGEPLLAKKFREYFLYCSSLNLPVSFTTNAQLLENWLEFLVGRLTQLNVSLDALSESAYRQRRGVSPKKAIRALKRLKALKDLQKTNLPEISLIVVLNQENVDELIPLIRFAAEIGAVNVWAYHQIFYSAEEFKAKSLFFTPEKADKTIKAALKLAEELKVEFIHPGTFDGEVAPHSATSHYLTRKGEKFFCQWIFNTTTVSWNGFVQSCCFCDRLFTGSLLEEDFSEIWNGPAYRYLRLRFLQGNPPPECQNCQFWQVLSLDEKAFLCPHKEKALYRREALIFKENRLNLREAERLYQKGLSLLVQEEYEAAYEIFMKIWKQENLYFEALNAAGVCLALMGQKEKACETLIGTLAIFPEEELVHHNWRQLFSD